jgi:hypothetical protein
MSTEVVARKKLTIQKVTLRSLDAMPQSQKKGERLCSCGTTFSDCRNEILTVSCSCP